MVLNAVMHSGIMLHFGHHASNIKEQVSMCSYNFVPKHDQV